jgi:site-specific recombinase XerD
MHKGRNFWLIRISKGLDPLTGSKRFKTVRYLGDRRGARQELDNLLEQESRMIDQPPTEMSVNELFDLWFEIIGENRYRENTLRGFKGIVAFDVRPTLGSVRVIDVNPVHLQDMFKRMASRGVGQTHMYRLYALIAKVFDRAVAWGFIENNPVSRVPVPRPEKSQIHPLTAEELRSFIRVTDRGGHSAFFRTAVVTN